MISSCDLRTGHGGRGSPTAVGSRRRPSLPCPGCSAPPRFPQLGSHRRRPSPSPHRHESPPGDGSSAGTASRSWRRFRFSLPGQSSSNRHGARTAHVVAGLPPPGPTASRQQAPRPDRGSRGCQLSAVNRTGQSLLLLSQTSTPPPSPSSLAKATIRSSRPSPLRSTSWMS